MRMLSVLVGLMALTAVAKPIQKPVKYEQGGTKFEGVLIYDDGVKTPRPGLVLVPNWLGINAANLKQAEQVAGTSYILFVADMYGEAARPKNQQEAGKAVGLDEKKLGAIGFCFGGTSVLELARSGADVAGVVSFHGGLDAPMPADAKGMTAKVLALHGADDPNESPAEVAGFQEEMRKAKADWQLVVYGNAVHSFTDVNANTPGQAQYNPKVAKRAYQAMNDFFAEAFGG